MNDLSADILFKTDLNDGCSHNLEIDLEDQLSSFEVFNSDLIKTVPVSPSHYNEVLNDNKELEYISNDENSTDVFKIDQSLPTYVHSHIKKGLDDDEPKNTTNYIFTDTQNTIKLQNNVTNEDKYSYLKEFDTLVNSIIKENIPECNKYNNLQELSNTGHKNTFENIEDSNDVCTINTWYNIYKQFALANYIPSIADNLYEYENGNSLFDIKHFNTTIDNLHHNLNFSEPEMQNELENKGNNFQPINVTNCSSYGICDQFKSSDNEHVLSISSDELKDTMEYPIDNIIGTNSNLDTTVDKVVLSSIEVKDVLEIKEEEKDMSDGYNSSDFEFIDEEEAKYNGLLHLISSDEEKDISKKLNANDYIITDYFKSIRLPDRNIDGDNHIIPDYVALFEGNFSPYPLSCFENKNTNSGLSMQLEFRGIDVKKELLFREKATAEQRREAIETEEKILSIYPSINESFSRRRK